MPETQEERAPSTEQESPEAFYLYCIIRCSQEIIFDGVEAIGEPGDAVHTVPQNGLAVVVSDSPVKQYESTRSNMMTHQRVIERVMQDFTVLPVRFGTVTNDFGSALQDVRKLLGSRFNEFDGLLGEMEGKMEVGLKVLWNDEKAVYEEIVASDPEIRRLRNSLSHRPPAAVRLEAIPLGQMVKEALDRKRASEASRILAPLRRIAHGTVENDTVLDRMVANAAFLVDCHREEEFDTAIRSLEAQLGDRVALRYVGPVPPYNFVNIVVNWEDL